MPTLAIDHLSHSQVMRFAECPRQWHYEKVVQAPRERVSSNLIFGIVLHDVLAAVNEATLDGTTIDAANRFRQGWMAAQSSQVPIVYGKRDGAEELLEKGLQLVACYQPPAGIIGIEQDFSLELDPALPPIVGRIDAILREPDGRLVLIDFKTSCRRVVGNQVSAEAQMGLYDLAYPAKDWRLLVFAKTAKPQIAFEQVIPWPRARLVRHYREVFQAMEAGVCYAHQGWQCESCPYRDRCHAD